MPNTGPVSHRVFFSDLHPVRPGDEIAIEGDEGDSSEGERTTIQSSGCAV